MLALLLRSLGTIGTFLGVLGILWSVPGLSSATTAGLWFLAGISALAILADVVSFVREMPYRYPPNDSKIKSYMFDWLSGGGRTAIFTRDLSWATPESSVTTLLKEKAARGELMLFVGTITPLVSSLREAGAEVYSYPGDFVPKSRFSIVDYQKHGARVAIGVVENKKHTIREYEVANSPLSSVLEDLVALVQSVGKRVK